MERRWQRLPMSNDTFRYFLHAVEAKSVCPYIPDNVHPHLFRHSRAMHLYRRGMDLTLISQWLCHDNLNISLIYAHADTEQKRQAIEKSIGGKVTGSTACAKKVNPKDIYENAHWWPFLDSFGITSFAGYPQQV